jgi:hypothetical protein
MKFTYLFLLLLSWGSFHTAQLSAQKPEFIMDMVHHNPGEALTQTTFNSPAYVRDMGFNVQVMNDFIFPTAALTFDAFDATLFPQGSPERRWTDSVASIIHQNIKKANEAGIRVFYFTDIVVLPKKLVEKYKQEVCDENGKISFGKPLTVQLHRMMFDELFRRFPTLDGLVIRTGETYLNNVPHHAGNNPISKGAESHIQLLNLLRDEVCVKHNKTVIYRTWSIGGFHNDPVYYLNVSDNIEPHKKLVFSIKHVQGDYHRTYPFNPSLGIGNHRQVVEVQCQREYEGKGAYPNYVMNGVINGFEEYTDGIRPNCLNDLKSNPNFAGIYSWSRGGGWVGPYISNEFWPRMNAFVLSTWANNPGISEEAAFNQFMDQQGITSQKSRNAFRKLCLLSAKAVLRGHMSLDLKMHPDWAFWMRDEFLAGSEPYDPAEAKKYPSEGLLYDAFTEFYNNGTLQKAVAEKQEAAEIWKKIVQLSRQVKSANPNDDTYIRVSSLYGLYLHRIIASGWQVMALGFEGDRTGVYNKKALRKGIAAYDKAWKAFNRLKQTEPTCATLYKPNAFIYVAPSYFGEKGMGFSVNKYR